jgi:hypothetical protein
MRRSRIALAVGLPAAAAGASWLATRELDRRRIRSDPEYARINAPLRGRPLRVTASDGIALHAEVFGPEGAPTLVLTHGWTCALRFWTYQIQALSDRFRVVAWDLRGHGAVSGRATATTRSTRSATTCRPCSRPRSPTASGPSSPAIRSAA